MSARGVIAGVVAGALVLAGARAAAACPADAGERAAAIRERLDGERRAAARWRWGWAAGFGAAALAQTAAFLTETTPTGDYDDAADASMKVGAAKATVGMAARIVAPIKVPRPSVSGDACADLASAEAAFARAAKSERQSFWLNHVGGLALQVSGTLYIGLSVDDAWGDAAISFGLGWTVGLISTYTQPRGVWKQHRAGGPGGVTWQVVPLAAPRTHGLAIQGTF